MSSDVAYTLIYEPNASNKLSSQDFKNILEKGSDEKKIDAMRQILITMLNSDPLTDLLMHIIRYVMPSRNKELKKLLYFYWEMCDKYDKDGKLKQEMILVCNAIQHDLQHPNEYIRGNTLRFLPKLKEPELLEPLVPIVRSCLDHRHAYVRKNAAFAIYSIYKVSDHLIPDAADLLAVMLETENDSTCKRNAFACLSELDRESALRYIQASLPVLNALDPLIQLAFIEFIRRDSVVAPELKQNYLDIVAELLDSSNSAVVYEAATTLSVLSSSQVAISSSASKFIELAIKEPDNNVKLIALERVAELNKKNPGVLSDMCLEILRLLSTPSLEVRKKAINITLELVTSRNVEDVAKLLKKELQRSITSDEEKSAEYRQLLISAMHTRLQDVAVNMVDFLVEFIGELNTTAATDVISFVKEVVEKYPNLRSSIIEKLLVSLRSVTSGKVFRGSLWILGEYCLEESDIQSAWRTIRSSIGEVPILAAEMRKKGNDEEVEEVKPPAKTNGHSGPVVLPDGTYATESALTSVVEKSTATPTNKTPLRSLILEGDFYLAAVLSSTLVKLVLRFSKLAADKPQLLNALKSEAMLIMVSILRVGDSSYVKKKIDEDSAERILSCVRFLSEDEQDESLIDSAFLEDTRKAFQHQLQIADKKKHDLDTAALREEASQVDDSIKFRQFSKDKTADEVTEDILLASGDTSAKEDLSSRLKKIVQLTGFSDTVYAEAYVKIQQFDVVLDVLIVNQTTATLRNLSVEFATLGDLKVVDKPTTQNVAPHGFHRVQYTVKVSSADTGVIFGNIVYDGQHGDESTIVILSDVHVDILDYIKPATCTESQFRKMWNEFEWENKITIDSTLPSLKDYLDAVLAETNMSCLTPGAIIGECQFLSANLYSRSSFGEDALANLCIEKSEKGSIVGHIRVRSKGQGLALSLGDKVAAIGRRSKLVAVTSV